MNVIHISTSVNPSSANTRLHAALQKEGIGSRILTLRCSADEPNIHVVEKRICDKVKDRFCNKFVSLTLKKYGTENGIPFSAGSNGMDLSRLEPVKNADIIHLHWICNFLSPKAIRKLIATGKPVVWTCHDSWPFTGGCHVRYGCERYRERCGQCPILPSSVPKDITFRILAGKEKYLSGQNISFIAPSGWMKDHIEKSRLFGTRPCRVIPNAISIVTFRELKDAQIQKRLGYGKDKNKLHVLFGATDVNIPYKGFRYLAEMLEALHNSHPEISKNIVLHVVGSGSCRDAIPNGYMCMFWGAVREPEKMAALYNLADLFVYPSIDDNLPNMVMESLACATPVVAFRTGGIPDMVEHMENGYLAKYMDTLDLMEGFLWVTNNNGQNQLGKSGRLKIMREFSEEIIARKHIQLYREMIERTEESDAF